MDDTLNYYAVTNETCILTNYSAYNCSSIQLQYQYEAVARSKCGNRTLYSQYDSCGDEFRGFIPGETEVVCYVNECEDKTFRFQHQEQRLWPHIRWIVGGSVMCCVPCWLACWFLNEVYQKYKDQNYRIRSPRIMSPRRNDRQRL